jgi:hypothetical protein
MFDGFLFAKVGTEIHNFNEGIPSENDHFCLNGILHIHAFNSVSQSPAEMIRILSPTDLKAAVK